MVNPSRFASDPRMINLGGSTLREKLPRSVRLRYVNWRFKKRQQVLYVADPAKKTKYVVVPGKQDIIGVEGIDDVDLFIDLPQKIRIIEAGIRKDDKPWAHKDGESRIVTS